ncbi:helix-turn-helix transcriptional regulator [Chitinophaga rhizosphaerae]|uniref:helix-turn-helix transcriptional regulator n=1 Tax=Chitinophaga rhizosphaerae TaxID=1864947 RepID=UPI000F809794|nr:helix-turn-helix transcriptional regulator [Chitinophaga rhizosphaerae]
MIYRQLPPPPGLRQFVSYCWTLESHAGEESQAFRTLADASPGLIFQHPEKGVLYQENKLLPPVFLYGQSTRHAALRLEGVFGISGMVLRPGALRSVFGLNAGELTDGCIDARELQPALAGWLEDAPGEAQLQGLSAFVAGQLERNRRQEDAAIEAALQRIQGAQGTLSIKDLRDELRMTERSFERRFKQYTGISPKLFTRISQFQASLQQMREGQFGKLSDLAYGNDYADQSHFIRAFQEFAGCSPLRFQEAGPVIDNLSAHFPR